MTAPAGSTQPPFTEITTASNSIPPDTNVTTDTTPPRPSTQNMSLKDISLKNARCDDANAMITADT
jgi:hypothetical protein